MTVDALTPAIVYPYTGAGDYPFAFDVQDEEHLLLTYTSTAGIVTTLALNDDYTVTLSSELGGTCSLTYAESDGTLTIRRRTPVTQSLRLVNNNALDMPALEAALDRFVMVLQDFGVDIDDLLTTFSWRGTWATASAYVLRDIIVATDSSVYICAEAHTAGTFATDLANGKWDLLVDVASVVTNTEAAETAQAAAEAAQAAAEEALADATDMAALAVAAEASAQGCATDAATSAASIFAPVELTSNTSLSEAQCTNKIVTCLGAASPITLTLPAVSSQIMFEIWAETPSSAVLVTPPSGERLYVDGVGIDIDVTIRNATVSPGDGLRLRRVKTESSVYAWFASVIQGTWAEV